MTLIYLLQFILLVACIDATSIPILYCVNEAASAGECSSEASQAAESTRNWFDAYMATQSDQKRERRHLLDCSRFCSSDVTYFTIHYPCDCKKNRRLTTVELPDSPRSLEYSLSNGPIQLFQSFVAKLPANDCRSTLEMSRCLITFVDKYDHDFSVPIKEVLSDDSLTELYNPSTGKYEIYDPSTGELAKPENTDNNNDDEIPDEIYDPVTKKYHQVDQKTGFLLGDGQSTPNTSGTGNGNGDEIPDEIYNPETEKYHLVDPETGVLLGEGQSMPHEIGSGNEDESVDEIYDPVTGKYQKVDQNTGTFIHDEGESPTTGRDGNEEYLDEVYDPVTKKYHKVDPNTGEYVDDVKTYDEVYDPSTGVYRKIDPATGKYID